MTSAVKRERRNAWRIAIVDDDLMVLRVYSEMLKLLGHKTYAFERSEDALNYIRQGEGAVDLLITDYRMPEINGMDLIRKIRESGNELPSMILTGFAQEVDHELIEAYRVKVLHKPIRVHDLNHNIHAFMDGHISSVETTEPVELFSKAYAAQ